MPEYMFAFHPDALYLSISPTEESNVTTNVKNLCLNFIPMEAIRIVQIKTICHMVLLCTMWLWFATAGQEAVWAEPPVNRARVNGRPLEAELQERRIIMGVALLSAFIGATLIYWLLWRRDFWGWRTMAESRFRIVPAPPVTAKDLLPVDSAFTMRPVIDYADRNTSNCFGHTDQIPGIEILVRRPDALRFLYRGHTFELGLRYDTISMCLFVEDPNCPDELLLEVANHFNAVATVVEHYRQPAPWTPLWNMLIVIAVLGAIGVVVFFFAG